MAETKYLIDNAELMAEWNWEKNIGISPNEITVGSGKKVWWICEKGHEYAAIIQNRTKNGSACPYCAKKFPVKGETDLATTHPHLLEEWDYESNEHLPEEYLGNSYKEVNWICKDCGHHWKTKIISRALKNRGCPICMLIKRGKTKTQNTIERRGSLEVEFPQIAKEWDFEKNAPLTPSQVHKSSKEIVWWKGVCGHSWKASVSHRVLGTGCPICAGKKVLAGFNDLASKSPDISKEWHPINLPLTPDKITFSSGKKVWWICEKGHSYQATVARRQSGSGCPYCSGRMAIEGENDLQTLYPDIAKQWHYEKNFPLLPSQIKPQSNKKVWWICEKGHEYDDFVGHRVARGTGCPYCSNHRVLAGFNDLKTINPKLAAEWHPYKNGDLKPSMVTTSGDTVVWWQCTACGHEWKVKLSSRRGCPRCSAKRMTSFPEQAIYFYISNTYPDAINRYKYHNYELDIFIPSQNTAIEYDGSFYHKSERVLEKDNIKDELCKKDGIRLIRFRDPGLPATSHAEIIKCLDSYRSDEFEKALKKLFELLDTNVIPNISLSRDWKKIEEKNRHYYKGNSVAELFPEIAKQWNYEKNGSLEPHNFTPGSGRKVWWRCENGHEWEATIGSRTQGIGCPYCSGRRAIKGVNDLLTLKPEIAAEWDYEKNAPLTPDQVTVKSNKRVWWKCSKCQHEWQSSAANRDQQNCKLCNAKLAGCKKSAKAVKRNNFAEKKPDMAKQWHPTKNGNTTPNDVSCGTSKQIWWICEKGHEWQSSISNRVKDNLGCPYCGNQKVLVGYNDFPTQFPEIAKEWNYEKNGGLLPENFVSGSGKKVWWKCKKCGYEWEQKIINRTRAPRCPKCGK